MIELDPIYKDAVRDIIYKFGDLEKDLGKPSDSTIDAFATAYWGARKSGCNRAGKGGCDSFFDEQLEKEITAKKDIIFETTGKYYPAWLVKMAPGHKVVMSFTLANICSLVARNKTRAVESVFQFLVDEKSETAPRLPDVTDKTYRSAVEAVRVLINHVSRNCLDSHNLESCSGTHIDRLLVYDNTVRPMRLVIDSDERCNSFKCEEIDTIVRTILAANEICSN